jgi:hypothetical protein
MSVLIMSATRRKLAMPAPQATTNSHALIIPASIGDQSNEKVLLLGKGARRHESAAMVKIL